MLTAVVVAAFVLHAGALDQASLPTEHVDAVSALFTQEHPGGLGVGEHDQEELLGPFDELPDEMEGQADAPDQAPLPTEYGDSDASFTSQEHPGVSEVEEPALPLDNDDLLFYLPGVEDNELTDCGDGHRFRRSPQDKKTQMGLSGGGGSNRGSVRLDVQRELLRSQNGRNTLHGGGHVTQSWGGGPPRRDYGAGLTFTHRFRRSPQDKKTQMGLSGGGGSNGGSVRLDVQRELLRSQNGRNTLHGGGHVTQSWGGGPPRRDYGAGLTFTHRFGRSPQGDSEVGMLDGDSSYTEIIGGNLLGGLPINDEGRTMSVEEGVERFSEDWSPDDEGVDGLRTRTRFQRSPEQNSVTMKAQQGPGAGGSVRVNAQREFMRGGDDSKSLMGNGFYRHNYGQPGEPRNMGGLGATFRDERSQVSALGQMKQGQGGSVRVDAQRDFLRSRDGRTSLQGGGYHQHNFGKAEVPRNDYGAGATFVHRFRRDNRGRPTGSTFNQQHSGPPYAPHRSPGLQG